MFIEHASYSVLQLTIRRGYEYETILYLLCTRVFVVTPQIEDIIDGLNTENVRDEVRNSDKELDEEIR